MTLLVTDFAALFSTNVPMIDTRAPVEYEKGSLPTAVNLPLMDDAERQAVGRCYKEQGPKAAVALGHELVAGDVRQTRLEAWRNFVRANPKGALFCFRGGLRSELVQQWLADAGVDYPRIAGGYKAMRRWLMTSTEHICAGQSFLLVAGKTGCAKTRLINQGFAGSVFPGAVDLEGLANHRGSSFGRRLGGQPSQIGFELRLDIALFRAAQQAPPHILLEDESRLIGRCALPTILQARMKTAPLVIVEASLEERIHHSFENYILANLADLIAQHSDDSKALSLFADDLRDALARIAKRLGGARYRHLSGVLEQALLEHAKGDPSLHRVWIEILLRDYYDPMYSYQLKNRQSPILFQGSEQQVGEFLQQHHAAFNP